jgi:hypothetical protein
MLVVAMATGTVAKKAQAAAVLGPMAEMVERGMMASMERRM